LSSAGVTVGGGCGDLLEQLRAGVAWCACPESSSAMSRYRGPSPPSRSRAARLRFTTADGQVIETVSDLSTFPGKKLGKRVTVAYDPKNPQRSADLAGVKVLKLVPDPLLIAGGAVLAAYAITQL
jgi:hypothetical protein